MAEYQLIADVWIRGILAERHGLPVTSVRYSFEQGLISRPREPAELFAPETREAHVI